MADDSPLDPIDAFALIGQIKLSETSLDGVLNQIAVLAKRCIPGTADVSVTLVRDQKAYSIAYTGDLSRNLDEHQYDQGHGPCLDAAASGETLSLPDMSTESRWPDLARRALAAGCHSSLSIGLPVHTDASGGLNIYATEPRTFDDEAVTVAETFAGYAAVALANAHLYDLTATLAQHMQKAMENRATIEQAKGIIMGDRHCTADEAFRILTLLSQDTNRKLRDVAVALVERASQTPRQ